MVRPAWFDHQWRRLRSRLPDGPSPADGAGPRQDDSCGPCLSPGRWSGAAARHDPGSHWDGIEHGLERDRDHVTHVTGISTGAGSSTFGRWSIRTSGAPRSARRSAARRRPTGAGRRPVPARPAAGWSRPGGTGRATAAARQAASGRGKPTRQPSTAMIDTRSRVSGRQQAMIELHGGDVLGQVADERMQHRVAVRHQVAIHQRERVVGRVRRAGRR